MVAASLGGCGLADQARNNRNAMNSPERELALRIELAMWANDAKVCPVCNWPWDVDSIKERNAIVASLDPRVLICEPCWKPNE